MLPLRRRAHLRLRLPLIKQTSPAHGPLPLRPKPAPAVRLSLLNRKAKNLQANTRASLEKLHSQVLSKETRSTSALKFKLKARRELLNTLARSRKTEP